MKTKTPICIGFSILICGALISCNDEKTNSYNQSQSNQAPTLGKTVETRSRTPSPTLEQAVKILNKFGKKLGKKGPISKEDEKIIALLAKVPIPIFNAISNNGALLSYFNFLNRDNEKEKFGFLGINPLTGKLIDACKIDSFDYSIKACNIRIDEPSGFLKQTLSINKPKKINITVIKGEGSQQTTKNVLATVTETTTISWEGSDCQLDSANRYAIWICVDRSNRGR